MSRTSIVAIVVVIVAIVGGYFYLNEPAVDAPGTAANVTAEVTERTQAAIDFCTAQGGVVETLTAAEGVLRLCVTADGNKTEIGQFMAANQ